ncbi:MAG TPA: VOC family protein [Ktedonobacterales bacterium]|jgi:predicted enzyme related to lactoylglutathione lyase
MLRKIDCIMLRVDNLAAAKAYYADVFGLRPLWEDEDSVGMGLPETDAEIVLHTKPDLPSPIEPYYLVEDVLAATSHFKARGCRVLVEPCEIAIGKCAIIADPFGTRLCILDMSKGPRRLD